jgi:hypothetical protein
LSSNSKAWEPWKPLVSLSKGTRRLKSQEEHIFHFDSKDTRKLMFQVKKSGKRN